MTANGGEIVVGVILCVIADREQQSPHVAGAKPNDVFL